MFWNIVRNWTLSQIKFYKNLSFWVVRIWVLSQLDFFLYCLNLEYTSEAEIWPQNPQFSSPPGEEEKSRLKFFSEELKIEVLLLHQNKFSSPPKKSSSLQFNLIFPHFLFLFLLIAVFVPIKAGFVPKTAVFFLIFHYYSSHWFTKKLCGVSKFKL